MERVNELIPHSGCMVLLDRIVSHDDNSLTAELTVRNDNLFAEDRIPAWIGIEYMAQTIAAYAGVRAKLAGEPIRLGFLLGTRRYHSSVANFTAGSVLTVYAEKVVQDGNLGVFSCQITNGDGIEVSAQLKVYQPPQAQILEKSLSNA